MFSLTFLNSGILFLASAIVIPILIYLFAKKKPKRIVFSSIKFIKESVKQQKRRIIFKNILLLLLRMLIILFTILALSRPAIKAPFIQAGTRHGKTAIALIIDNSYSMDYLIDTKTELDYAKEIALEINQMVTDEDVVILYTRDESWNQLYSQPIYGSVSENTIHTIDIAYHTLSMDAVLTQAQAALKDTHIPNQEIFVITDFHQSSLPEKVEPEIPTFYIPTSDIEERINLSCQNAHIKRDYVGASPDQQIAFDLANHSNTEQNDILVQLVVNEQTLAEKMISLQPQQKISESFSLPLEEMGWYAGYVEVKNERFPPDNRSYFSFYYNPEPQVAVFSDQQEAGMIMETFLNIYTDPENISFLDASQTTVNALSAYDLILIYNKKTLSEQLRFILEQFITTDNSCIIFTNKDMDSRLQDLISIKFNTELSDYYAEPRLHSISEVNPYHPVSAPLQIAPDVNITDYWQSSTQATSLLATDNYPLVVEENRSSLILFDIESKRNPFIVNPAFPVMLYNIFQYSSNTLRQRTQAYVGETMRIRSQVITRPDGNEIKLSSPNYTFFTPGIYHLQDHKLAVNIHYEESDFQRISETEFANIELLEEDWQDHIFLARYGVELWKYFLLLALLGLLVEMFIIKKEERKTKFLD